MDLNPRKLRILKTIIDEYILSAAPVGSKFIAENVSFRVSPATIRNEMADLEELGYLEQPHTSAGRIPSDKAYRLYVDNMMQRAQLSPQELNQMKNFAQGRIKGMDAIMRETASVLSHITHYTSLVLMPESSTNRLRHLQLVPLSEGYALVVVVTDAGVARDSVIRIPTDMGSEELDMISRMISQSFYNCPMSLIAGKLEKELGDSLRDRSAFIEELLHTMEGSLNANAHRLALSGATRMLEYPEYNDFKRARDLMTAVEKKDELYRMVKNAGVMEVSVRIGSELGEDIFKDCSLVTATYSIGEEPVGVMGIIGPTRMQYGKVVSVLEYMRMSLGAILTNLLEEE